MQSHAQNRTGDSCGACLCGEPQGAEVCRLSQRNRPNFILDLERVTAPADSEPCALRIVREGTLVPTRLEVAEQERQSREQERSAAEARIRELEAALAGRR